MLPSQPTAGNMGDNDISPALLLNADFETDFELDNESESTLDNIIRNEEEINRVKITTDRIHNTSFSAKLTSVYYGTYKCQQADGTYKPEAAALVVFAFHFGFKHEKRDRFKSATITVEFEETLNAKFDIPPNRNPRNDPQIKFFAPYQICGEPSKESVKRQWKFGGRLGYQAPGGPGIGVNPAYHAQARFQKHHRMWIQGETDSDHAHRFDNRVIWDIEENKIEGSGILRDFPAAAVVVLPNSPEHLVKITVLVTPYVAFSLNPRRLRQKRDDPILLDRETEWGPPLEHGRDFSDPDYPWSSIVKMPTEYEEKLHPGQ